MVQFILQTKYKTPIEVEVGGDYTNGQGMDVACRAVIYR